MARLARLNLPNVPEYIVQRGNNRHATEKSWMLGGESVQRTDRANHRAACFSHPTQRG